MVIMIKRYSDVVYVVFLLSCFLRLSDGQSCIGTTDIYDQRRRFRIYEDDSQVIIPAFSFSCNGRITGVSAGMHWSGRQSTYMPEFQVWHPLSPGSNAYSKIGQVQFQIETPIRSAYYTPTLLLTGNDQLEFQSRDVIGIYQPSYPFFRISNVFNENYTSYYNSYDNLTTTNISSGSYNTLTLQPVINVFTDVRCDDLSTPSNGRITSCSSGRVGVGYERDNCSFTCNTGYELTGSDTTTCQSDGSWSDSDVMCSRVSCSTPVELNNGVINCLLGNDRFHSYEDNCSFTCNTGYELTGSDTRTCQSDGSWSGTENVCKKVSCIPLTDPDNGMINCSLGDDGVPSYEDTCSFACNTGYELTGSDTRTCQSNGNWSGSDDVCRKGNSSDSNSDGIIIVAFVGAIAAALIIIILLCAIVLYARQSHKKRSYASDNKTMIEMSSDIMMNTNPSYSIAKQNTKQEDQYDYVLHDNVPLQDDPQGTIIRMDSNPSYGKVRSCNTFDVTEPEHDAAIQPNPAYSCFSKETTKMSEDQDQDGYVETNSQSTQIAGNYLKLIGSTTKEEESIYDNRNDDAEKVETNPIPSYDSVSAGVKLEDNPSSNKIKYI